MGALRILFYNIRYGTGCGWTYHLPLPFSGFFRSSLATTERIGAYLDDLDVDVACLCEVDGGSYRQGGQCQARRLAASRGLQPVFAPKYGPSPLGRLPILSRQGNAVLSRLPVVKTRENYFSRGVKRSLLEVEFDGFVVLLAHLSLGQQARRVQLGEIARRCLELDKPVLVGGDFNLLRGDRELGPFLEATGLRDADTRRRPTFPSRLPSLRLDCLLASPEIEIRGVDVPQVTLSDHLPLLCDVALGGRGGKGRP